MTEAEWEASEDPGAMLRYLQEGCGVCDGTGSLGGSESPKRPCDRCGGWQPAKPSNRKLRLFAVACCRAMDPRPRQLRAEQESLENEERAADENSPGPDGPYWWISSSNLATRLQATWATLPPPALRPVAALLRDIIGNPFRPVTLTRTVECDRCNGKGQRTIGSKCGSCEGTGKTKGNADWLTPTVCSLAQAGYEERTPGRPHKKCRCGREFARLQKKGLSPPLAWCNHCAEDGGWWADAVAREPDGTLVPLRLAVLADALEEAGCDNTDMMLHLRSPGPHVRGCWPIDLLTGKE